MKAITIPFALLAAGLGGAHATAGPTNAAPANRILIIDASAMPVAAGHATLTIGPLQRTNGVYTGDYKIKVSPYFFKNEKGTLAITVSDVSLAEIARGEAAAITGTATTSGKGGVTRPIEATATPADTNHGTLKLWFMAGDRKMIFQPAYHFADKGTSALTAKPAGTASATNFQSRLQAPNRAAMTTADKLP
jgi:hypothetical protein